MFNTKKPKDQPEEPKKNKAWAAWEEELNSPNEKTRRKVLATLAEKPAMEYARSSIPLLVAKRIHLGCTGPTPGSAAVAKGESAENFFPGVTEMQRMGGILWGLIINQAALQEAATGDFIVTLLHIALVKPVNEVQNSLVGVALIAIGEVARSRDKIIPGVLKTEYKGKRYVDHLVEKLEEPSKADPVLRALVTATSRETLLSTIWNLTSIHECRPIFATAENVAIMLKTLTASTEARDNKSKHAIAAFFHNVSQYSDEVCDLLRNSGVVQALSPIVSQKVDGRLSAMMAIVNIIGVEETKENEILVADNGMIERIVGELRGVLLGFQFIHEEETGESKSSFDLVEILLALSRLSVNDKNKRRFFEAGVVDHLMMVLDKEVPNSQAKIGSSGSAQAREDQVREMEDSLVYALKTLINLCFVEEIRATLLKNTALIKLVNGIIANEDLAQRVKDTANRFLWAVKNGGDVHDPSLLAAHKLNLTGDQNLAGKHIMISYSWADQAAVLKIKNCLRAAGFSVWIDVESLHGSTVDSMARAVEGSAVVLICFSEKYKQSQNCRMEANYALQRGIDIVPLMMQKNYQPDGWLGLLLASRLYVDFSSPETFDQKFKNLTAELGMRGKVGPSDNATMIPSAQSGKAAQINGGEVETWLVELGLEAHIDAFRTHDMLEGSALLEFLECSSYNLAFAHEQLVNHLGVKSLGLRLRFFRELRKFLEGRQHH